MVVWSCCCGCSNLCVQERWQITINRFGDSLVVISQHILFRFFLSRHMRALLSIKSNRIVSFLYRNRLDFGNDKFIVNLSSTDIAVACDVKWPIVKPIKLATRTDPELSKFRFLFVSCFFLSILMCDETMTKIQKWHFYWLPIDLLLDRFDRIESNWIESPWNDWYQLSEWGKNCFRLFVMLFTCFK